MVDYKLIVTTPHSEEGNRAMADTIMEDHGDDFDADRGDFAIEVKDREFQILIKDVGDGDARALADQILEKHGEVSLRASKGDGGTWFPFDLEENG